MSCGRPSWIRLAPIVSRWKICVWLLFASFTNICPAVEYTLQAMTWAKTLLPLCICWQVIMQMLNQGQENSKSYEETWLSCYISWLVGNNQLLLYRSNNTWLVGCIWMVDGWPLWWKALINTLNLPASGKTNQHLWSTSNHILIYELDDQIKKCWKAPTNI